jgi:long-chain acyl-CoA synthetase
MKQEPRTLTELYFGAQERYRDNPVALRHRPGDAWVPISYRALHERVRAASLGLLDLGIAAGDRVAILSENRPEWAVIDYACLAALAVDVPIYPTLVPHQIAYLLNDSGATAVCVSTQAQLDKILEIRADVPALRWIIGFDADLTGDEVIPIEVLEARGRTAVSRHPAWRVNALAARPDDLATIIYTSGTTGEPKGVMLTHGNIASNVRAGCAVLPISTRDECLSFLPLSHIFERMVGHYSMLEMGVVINYARSIDTVPQDLMTAQPTVVAAVPRLYEKMYARALETAVHRSALSRRVFLWAKRVGDHWTNRRLGGESIPLSLAISHRIADRLVYSKLRARTGGRLRYFISGGAPLSADIARFFYAARIPILEGYGLTETSPVISVNTLEAIRLGTVGHVVPSVEVRIAEDGEILVRGPNVMQGYFNKPEATAEAIDPEGWFHTGDIGEFDDDGYLRITDRKKDLIATAGGKKIAPQPIEDLLRRNPFIANAVMLGDKRQFPIMLLAPDFQRLEAWARGQGLTFGSREELVALPEVTTLMEAEAKKHLRDLARYEVPKRFLVIPGEFSIETGELTPKLSVKRKVVEAHYRDQIDDIYQQAEMEHGDPA